MFFLFPIGTAERPRRQPLTTITLILLTVTVYAVSIWGSMPHQQVIDRWGYIPNEGTPATFLTAIFIHRGPWLMALNLWILWLFGPLLESRLGHFPFLLLYLAGGLVGWATAGAFDQGTDRLLAHVGSSGALAAVMGAFVVLYPFTDLKVWYFWAFLFYYGLRTGVFRLVGVLVIGLWFAAQLFALWIESRHGTPTIDLLSQMGGFVFGVVAGIVGFGKEGLHRETSYGED